MALAISVIAMAGLTTRAVIAQASCSKRPVIVNLAVSYDIASSIQTIARTYNAQNERVGGRCVQIQVTQGQPSAVAAQIDGQTSLQGIPPIDAWIPDSSLWVDVARNYGPGAQLVQQTGINIAKSPIMLVTSQQVARKTGVFSAPATWNLLLPPAYGGPPASLNLSVDIPDPNDSAVGLSTLIEINRLLGTSPAARAAFTKFVLTTERTAEFNSAAALQSFVGSTGAPFYRRAIAEASEQAVIAYDRANPGQPLAARYPTAPSSALATPELDYPYVVTSPQSVQAQAALAFGRYLLGTYAQSVLRYDGFRSSTGVPDQLPGNSGLSGQPLQLASKPSPSETATNLSAWKKLGLGSRVLTIIDTSAAMGAPAGLANLNLEQVLTQTASRGLPLFPDTTQMGLWEAPDSSDASANYKSLVPLGPLPADWGVITRREQIEQIDLTLKPNNNPLHLNDAILAGYKLMTKSFAANYSNAVLVLTAGADAPGDMKLQSLISQLKSLYNPNKRIVVIIIQFGHQGSFQQLKEIANATTGAAYQITNPADVGKIFIEAIGQRLCNPGCSVP